MILHKHLIFLVAAALALSACGGGGSSSSSGSTSPSQATSSTKSKQAAERTSGGGKIAGFGQEAGGAERDAASQILEENLDARAGEDWAGQCASLSAQLTKQLVERAELITGKKGSGTCAKGLEVEAEPIPKSVLKSPMTGPIDALRVKGKTAYAIFTGTGGTEYAMPMLDEGGNWKVNQLTTLELGKGD